MASEKQAAFVRSLFGEIEENLTPVIERPEAVALLAEIEAVKDVIIVCLSDDSIAVDEIERSVISTTIDSLISIRARSSQIQRAVDIPQAIAAVSPKKVIRNRFRALCGCGASVDTEAGYAVLTSGWQTWCVDCAESEDRAARLDERRKEQDAEREREEAERQRIEGLSSTLDGLVRQLWDRAGVADAKRGRNLGIAVPDPTGRNDLRFYRVQHKSGWDSARVFEVIGGRPDSSVDLEPSIAVVASILDIADLGDAMRTFGIEIGVCGRCGEHLTDEESRARGIGPVCARKVA